MKSFGIGLAALALVAAAPSALASTTYSFSCFTNNNAASCAGLNASGQIEVAVSNPSGDQVQFLLTNALGGLASSIANVYWQSNLLNYSAPVITNSVGVSFATGGAPPNLPSGNTLSPSFTTDFRVSADSPAPSNGINPGEQLAVTLALASNVTFQQFIDSLNNPVNGDSRIGLHVISIGTAGDSESLVLVPHTVIPVPGALPLMLSGLLGLTLLARRRSKAA